jgi:hypothetical protein
LNSEIQMSVSSLRAIHSGLSSAALDMWTMNSILADEPGTNS